MSGGILGSVNDALFGAPPDSPDYMALANQQMQAGRPDQTTPFGFSNWTQDANGNWSQQVGFSPEMQGLYGQLVGAAGQGLAGGIGSGDDAFRQSQEAAWKNAQANLLPQLQKRYDAQHSALINQGADVGNRALYGSAMQDMNRDYDAGLAGAWGQSMQQGLNAQNLTYQQNKDAYMAPFSLLGGMQGMLQMPGFQTAGNYQQAGAQQFGSDMAGYNAAQQGITGLLQGAGDVAGAFAGMPPTGKKPGGGAGFLNPDVDLPFSFGGGQK